MIFLPFLNVLVKQSNLFARMAESLCKAEKDEVKEGKSDFLECAVCLQQCIHPVELPCGHIFCFLCVKGFANQSKRCAMCRQEIPRDFLEQPKLVQTVNNSNVNPEGFDGGYQWFYEGRNGWWQYDERTSQELEISYKKGEKTCELLIAGFLYIVDLENMLQLRRNDPSRRRKIKRDFASIPKKGIAGLRNGGQEEVVNSYPIENRENLPNTLESGISGDLLMSTNTPANTPQTPLSNSTSGRESPHEGSNGTIGGDNNEELQVTMDRINALRLDENPTRLQSTLNRNTIINLHNSLRIGAEDNLLNYNENFGEDSDRTYL